MTDITITNEMQQVLDMIENTSDHIFITGKAGTGKTTLLRHIVATTNKNCVVAASTGIAAVNANGTTLHSLFHIPFGPLPPDEQMKGWLPKEKQELLCALDTLIIDEISMVRPDVLDFADRRLRQVRRSAHPFGGVQVVMIGDLYQLPPVIKRDEMAILKEYYQDGYFFNARAFQERGFSVIELQKIFRQSDRRFIEILNNLRTYHMTAEDIEDLSALRDKYGSEDFSTKAIHICTHKRDVDRINRSMLGQHTHAFKATFKGKFNENSAPCDKELLLRVGARVMTLINDRTQGFYNGSLGVVKEIKKKCITVTLDNGTDVLIEKNIWETCDYKKNDKGKIIKESTGSCTQFPLALAWAITIHKSQGLTFDNIVIHTKGVFCPGQMYVALSRCTSMEGIISDTFIGRSCIIPNKALTNFEKAYKQTGNYFKADTSK